MIDTNYELRKAYYSVITGLGYPCYYQYAPETETSSAYVILASINNTDTSTKSSIDTSTTIQVKIYTKGVKGNSGSDADTMANAILGAIKPTPSGVISITGSQVLDTTIVSDLVQDYADERGYMYVDRFITIRHSIFQQ